MRAAIARTDSSRCWISARLGGRYLRRDDLLAVWKDEREEPEEPLEVTEEGESAQFLRARRVIARSKRAARAPRRPHEVMHNLGHGHSRLQ
jgi:hypothetical protein